MTRDNFLVFCPVSCGRTEVLLCFKQRHNVNKFIDFNFNCYMLTYRVRLPTTLKVYAQDMFMIFCLFHLCPSNKQPAQMAGRDRDI